MRRILLAGGGSGGHVTPLRAISKSLQQLSDEPLQITVISDRTFFSQTAFLFKDDKSTKLKKIYSGKFRRYNGKSLLWHLTHLPTVFMNVRDIFLILLGIIQSIAYFLRRRPDVVFCKGGFVCVPVGITAWLFKVPIVIHDSDTHPGLTNRFLSRWAVKIGTGMPTRYYNYPEEKMIYSGIPVQKDYHPFTTSERKTARQQLGIDVKKPTVLVTGGGTGAQELNSIVVKTAPRLIKAGWQILHLTGKGKAHGALKGRGELSPAGQKAWYIQEFSEVAPLAAAADIIVSRAGATAMQEFANAQKPVIVVPNPYLTGGHQLKNAAMFKENEAALVLHEVDLKAAPDVLEKALKELWTNTKARNALATCLHSKFAKPHASDEIAAVILDA